MNWGSTWTFTDYTCQNWWNLFPCGDVDVDEIANPGGTAFDKREPNPLIRVRPPQRVDAPVLATERPLSTLTSTESANLEVPRNDELIYATETFDRQQPVFGIAIDSRWLAGRRGFQVPVLDDRLVVAFQKFLRDEEATFLLLILASEEAYP